jgi:F420-non-reducing hydrogenase small subunit
MSASAGGAGANGKLKVAKYWAASCGGCDISLLEIGPHLLELIEAADVVFWPCVADFKYHDVAGYPDGYIDVCLFNGGVRSSEHEKIARLLRLKSKTMVAYGSCAIDGGIPALANLSTVADIKAAVYHDSPSTPNKGRVEPALRTETPYGELELPALHPQVLRLSDVVEVDYQIPGCPPQAHQVWKVLQAIVAGAVPARNTAAVIGCDDKVVCDECPREKRKTRIKEFVRPHMKVPEPDWCLLEQGFVCMGPATRSGCGALCLKANLPCRGCYTAPADVQDRGTAMIGAIGSLLDATTEEKAQEMVARILDPVGTFYRFSLASSMLKGRR